jgi:hypothetical protein
MLIERIHQLRVAAALAAPLVELQAVQWQA